MRRHLVTCLGLVVLASPVCAVTTSLAALFGGYSAPVIAPPTTTPTVTAVSTTSPYYGFSNTGIPTSTYAGTVTTVTSSVTSLSSLFGGSSSSVSNSIVSNMSPTTSYGYVPQYVSSAPTTYSTSYSAPTSTSSGTGGAVSLASLFSGTSMRTPVTQTYYRPPTVTATGTQVNVSLNPEPGTIALMLGGLGAVFALRIRAKRRARA